MKNTLRLFGMGCCGVLGGALATWLGPRVPSRVDADYRDGPAPLQATSEVFRLGERFESIARRVSPAVVYVEANKPGKPAPSGKSAYLEESGSGVLAFLENETFPFVLTNNHVISPAQLDQVSITLADGRIFRPSRMWSDPESDVAILRLDGVGMLPTVTLGDSDRVRVGQWSLAFGSPFGLSQSMTHGIISARDRGQVSLGNTIRIKEFLQTDAAINPGSSGGPLVNLDGEVIGINTAIASNSGSHSGIAFSIPINLIKKVANQLLKQGYVNRGYLGLQLMPSFEPGDAWKLGLDRVTGAWIETVYPETPAALAGLRANDVILQVDGVGIRHENHFINLVSEMTPGKKVRVQVWRDKRLVELEAMVGDWTKDQNRLKTGM